MSRSRGINYRNVVIRELIEKLVYKGKNLGEIANILKNEYGIEMADSTIHYHYSTRTCDESKYMREYIMRLRDKKNYSFQKIANCIESKFGKRISKQAVWEQYKRGIDMQNKKLKLK